MAGLQQSVETLQAELIQLRAQSESLAPKFGGYDMMLQENGPWKAGVERLLTAQGVEQAELIIKQGETIAGLQELYDKDHASLRDINNKLVGAAASGHGDGGGGKKWQMSRPKDLEAAVFTGKDEAFMLRRTVSRLREMCGPLE